MQLRKAIMDDAGFILDMRNDEKTRENSFNKDIISFDSHVKWFEKKLSDPNCRMLIMVDGEARVGSIRLDITGDNGEFGEISYMIAPDKRGKGYGKAILNLVCDYVSGEEECNSVKVLAGFVKQENKASIRCFTENGFAELVAGDINCFLKTVRK